MLILYHVLTVIFAIAIYMEYIYVFPYVPALTKYRNIIKPVLDCICGILICIISVVGCFSAPSFDISFAVIYIAIYCLVKEIYDIFITKRRERTFILALQSNVEKKIRFNNLFEFVETKKEKLKTKTKWIITDETNMTIGLFFGNKRSYYHLKKDKYFQNIDYIVNQFFEYAPKIKNESDLNKLIFYIIKDDKMALNFGNEFVPHNLIKNNYRPFFYNSTFFNITMMNGYISIYVFVALVKTWVITNIYGKILGLIINLVLAIPFVLGVVVILYAMFDSLIHGLKKHE